MKKKVLNIPSTNELTKELQNEKFKYKYKKILKSTIYTLIVVIAFSSLASTLLFPMLEIHGYSMSPTITQGDIVLGIKRAKYQSGDIVAFYYNNRILVKRVVACSSDWVSIDEEGNVYVNDKLLNEPYVNKKMLGDTDIEYPYQVPDNSYFILGDKRENSIDSRNSLIGTISEEDIIGKIVLRVWPLKEFKFLSNIGGIYEKRNFIINRKK